MKNWKRTLSLLFVAVLLLQAMGLSAAADYDPSVTGSEPLTIAVYIPWTDEYGSESSALLDGETVTLPEGQALEMRLGDSYCQPNAVFSLSALMWDNLVVTPPSDYYISEAYIYGDPIYSGQQPASLKAVAEYPGYGSTGLTLKHENFVDANSGGFDSARLTTTGGAYTLLIRLEKLEDIQSVAIGYSGGDQYVSVPNGESGYPGSSFIVQGMSDSVEGKVFTGWALTYNNGSAVDVVPGDEIRPYADCTLVAQWEDSEEGSGPVPGHEHSYSEEILTSPSCTDPGLKLFTCSCGDSYTQEIPALGHEYSETVVPPTTEADGYTEHVCVRCGDSYRDNYQDKLQPAHEHSYTEAVTTEPGCVTPGVKTFTCSCGDSYTEEIPALGHSYTEAVTTQPNCTDPGVKTFTCSRCGDSYTQEIPALGHSFETNTVEPTVSSEGYTLHKCTVCGYEYRDGVVPRKEIAVLPAPAFSTSEWTRGSDSALTATVNYDFSKFDRLLVDGSEMTRGMDYNVREGSTVVEIGSGTLEKLMSGTHELKLLFTDAQSTGQFTVKDAPAPAKTALVVKAKDRTAEYNGQNITSNEFEILSGSLAVGDHLQVEYGGGSVNVTDSAVGSITRLTVLDSSGRDVTGNYSVSVQNGTVRVTARPLNISGQNVQKTYDGNAYSIKDDYAGRINSDKLSGHSVSVSLDFYQNGTRLSEARTAGSYDIMLSGFSVKENGMDVSSNYRFNGTLPYKLGTLTISGNPASMLPITVTARSQTWTYDGQPHECREFIASTALSDGDTMTVSFDPSCSITNVGSVANRISTVTIKDRNGAAVAFALNGQGSGKYNVTLAEGTLKVDPFKLTLTAVSAEKTYDGSALKNDNVKATSLVSGHKFSVVKFAVTDSRGNLIKNGPVEVGTYTKKVTDVSIVDSRGNDVTNNYDISKVDGTLKVVQGNISSNTKSPQTGDQNKLGLWIGLLAASALVVLGIVGYFYFRGKKGAAKPFEKKRGGHESKK